MNKFVPITTADGSRTLYDVQKNIHFRSLDGARSESAYVFYQNSGLPEQSGPYHILELGLGTGLNLLVTLDQLAKTAPEEAVHYHVVESQALPVALFLELQHDSWLHDPGWNTILATGLNRLQTESQPLTLTYKQAEITIYPQRWQDCQLPAELQVQAIYHDPFGPQDNPDCWTVDCFRWSSQHLSDSGRLVTYAASTQMRRAMVEAGLVIASLPGSGRKREMTVATRYPEAMAATAKILKNRRFYAAN